MLAHYTLGSLFDGSGGFPLAGALCSIQPLWASEIEPYPIAVTRSRFPHMQHLGSVTEIDGGAIPPVDIVTFGSPCQDMSVAGKRAGMQHAEHGADDTTRSGLFYEAVRIIKEMRESTNGSHPTFAVWENVPGAFTSNRGEDFRCVLQALQEVCGGGYLFLDLRTEGGLTAERCWVTDAPSRGESSTRSIGESPSAAVESTLWQILEAGMLDRYYLSARACAGVLRRAERRGKELPQMLQEALEEAVAMGA